MNIQKLFLVLLFSTTLIMGQQAEPHSEPRKVGVRFIQSPLADYLIYLFYRGTGNGRFQEVEREVPLSEVPTLNELVSLPGLAASQGVDTYAELQPLLAPYRTVGSRIAKVTHGAETRYTILGYSAELPSFDFLSQIIAMGKARYPDFKKFWEEKIAPEEAKKIEEWQAQLEAHRPLETLQRLARLRFPSATLDIVVIGMHGAGSANPYPAAIYTGISVRNLAWAIGHEGTHLLVDRYAGANWAGRQQAEEAIQLVEARGGHDYDIEEALCLLMQVKLSQAAGLTPADYRLSQRMREPSVKRDLLRALEENWDQYLQTNNSDLIDWGRQSAPCRPTSLRRSDSPRCILLA